MVSQVNKVRFGILGDADILNMSVCLVDKPTFTVEMGSVYDRRMGCISNNSQCPTCSGDIWNCPGHFGHIELNMPIILFYKQCVPFLKCFCHECHRLLAKASELELNEIKGYDKVLNYVGKLSYCGWCNTPHPNIKLVPADMTIVAVHTFKLTKASRELTPAVIKAIFDNVLDEDVKLFGVDVNMFHPRNFVLTKFLVLPTCCRSRMVTANSVATTICR